MFLECRSQSVTFLVSKPVSKPKCQSQECDIFGFDTGFETKMSFSATEQKVNTLFQMFYHAAGILRYFLENSTILIS